MTDEVKRIISALRRDQISAIEITTSDLMDIITLAEVADLIERMAIVIKAREARISMLKELLKSVGGFNMKDNQRIAICPYRVHKETRPSLTVEGESYSNEYFMPCEKSNCPAYKRSESRTGTVTESCLRLQKPKMMGILFPADKTLEVTVQP